MKRRHFERLAPVCPVCRGFQDRDAALAIAAVYQEEDGDVVQGILHCTRGECRREYPILDGIPLLIADLRGYLADNLLAALARDDLAAPLESIVGDCCGPGSGFDTMRQYLSSYVWDHYGDLDPDEPAPSSRPVPGEHDRRTEGSAPPADRDASPGDRGEPPSPNAAASPAPADPAEPTPGATLRTLETGLALAGPLPDGPAIDLGCSAGRAAAALTAHTDDLVLGVDLYLPTLRVAAQVLRGGRVVYPRRRVGVVYDRRDFAVDLPGHERVDVWACDATALPFAPGTFGTAVGLNLLDSVRAPAALLSSTATVLAPGGLALISCPYDFSPAVTPIEAWVGGHSQRGPDRGDSATLVRKLLTPGALPSSIDGLALTAELDDVPWHVRMHERNTVHYRAHLVVARRAAE